MRHQYLDVLATDTVDSSHVSFFKLLRFCLFFHAKNNTRRVPHRHKCRLALKPLIPFFRSASGFLRETNCTIFHESEACSFSMKRSWEKCATSKILRFSISLTNLSSGPSTLPSHNRDLVCSTESTEISAILSSKNCSFPSFPHLWIRSLCCSSVPSGSTETPSQYLCSSFSCPHCFPLSFHQ